MPRTKIVFVWDHRNGSVTEQEFHSYWQCILGAEVQWFDP